MNQRVRIAEWRVARAPVVLKACGLGSCLAVSLHDPQQQLGALGHMLLPSWSNKPLSGGAEGKFVDAGIRRMAEALNTAGADPLALVAKIAGGANMFESEDQSLIASIGARNARSARQTLALLDIPLLAEDIGGNRGRTVEFDLASGSLIIYCARGEERKLL